MKEERTARAWRYSSERSSVEGDGGGGGVVLRGLEVAEALQGAEDFVADLGLDGDEIEGGYVDGASGADALAGDVEELPVEVEAFVGAEEVSGEDEVDEEFFADAEGVELLGGDGHQRAGWADDERGHAGEAGGDGVGEGVAVERGDVGGAEVDEGEDDDAVFCLLAGRCRIRGSARRAWRGCRWCAFLLRGCRSGRRPCDGAEGWMSSPGMRTESSCMAIMMVLRDSRTSAAEAKRAEGCFSRQRRMTDSSSTGRLGAISRMEGGSANWMARMDWNSGASGRWKGWRPVASS